MWGQDLTLLSTIWHPTGDINAIVHLPNNDIAVGTDTGVFVHTADASRAADTATLTNWAERAAALQVAAEAAAAPQQTTAGGWDYSYPVELPGSSTKMDIQWNR